MPDYRQRPRRIHGRHLYVACKPPARALRGHRTGRAAHDDDRRGEFPGLLLPQKGRSRGRRRRHRLRGGHLPRLDLPQGLHDRAQTPPARLEGDAAAGVQHPQHRGDIQPQHRRGTGRRVGRDGCTAALQRRQGGEDRHLGLLPGHRAPPQHGVVPRPVAARRRRLHQGRTGHVDNQHRRRLRRGRRPRPALPAGRHGG